MSGPTVSAGIICPPWCEDGRAHDPWFVGEVLRCDHQGPTFGEHVRVSAEQAGETLIVAADVCVEENNRYTVQGLRKIATELLKAADFMEAQGQRLGQTKSLDGR